MKKGGWHEASGKSRVRSVCGREARVPDLKGGKKLHSSSKRSMGGEETRIMPPGNKSG